MDIDTKYGCPDCRIAPVEECIPGWPLVHLHKYSFAVCVENRARWVFAYGVAGWQHTTLEDWRANIAALADYHDLDGQQSLWATAVARVHAIAGEDYAVHVAVHAYADSPQAECALVKEALMPYLKKRTTEQLSFTFGAKK